MKFYNRKTELEQLANYFNLSKKKFFFIRITGRRRIGKTRMVEEFSKSINAPVLYFFVTKQNEASILSEFQSVLGSIYPEYQAVQFNGLSQFFQTIFELHTKERLITIFDEFQNFKFVNPASFSMLQKELDGRMEKMKGMLLVIGSLQTMMTQIFEDSSEPLFGRLNASMHISSFNPAALNEMFISKKPGSSILDYYTVFGGVPHYYKLVDDYGLWGRNIHQVILELLLKKDSILSRECHELLLGEFGQNYSTWFSILKAVAGGCTRLSEIVNHSGVEMKNINRFLKELVNYYQLIERRTPVASQPKTKQSRYYIKDHFIRFWFRYIYRHQSLLEFGSINTLQKIIKSDFNTYQGKVFEDFMKEILIEQNQRDKIDFDEIGSWWDRGKNEIDIITLNHRQKKICFYECKLRTKKNLNNKLIEKSQVFLKGHPQFQSYLYENKFLFADQLKF